MTQSLKQSQAFFWQAMHEPVLLESDIESTCVGSVNFTAIERLSLYREMFWFRQIAALAEAFPSLSEALGPDTFRIVARAYIDAHPSQDPRLEYLGQKLPEFIAAHPNEAIRRQTTVAAIDCARLKAQIAADPVQVLTKLQMTPETFSSARFQLIPSLQVVATDTAGRAFWRSRFHVEEVDLAADEHQALIAAQTYEPAGVICEAFAGHEDPGRRAFEVLGSWLSRGWLSQVFAMIVLLSACSTPPAEPASVAIDETPGPNMRPGWNCSASGCHFPAGQTKPPPWGAGGTVFASKLSSPNQGISGATVTITDSQGKRVSLPTNNTGNFYTLEKLAGPLDVALEYQGRTIRMPTPAPAGSCNFCHTPTGDAKGRIFVP